MIAIPSGVYEFLHRQLYKEFEKQLRVNGVPEDAWLEKAATYFRSNHPGSGGGGGGEGDSTGAPKSRRLGYDGWPTLVILAGASESLNQLRADMRWWFVASTHDVKIAILARFDQRQFRIILEKWEEQAATLRPVLQQVITITRDATTPVSYNVSSSALVLEFRLLFLRNPSPLEKDVVISVQSLQEYAELVWSEV